MAKKPLPAAEELRQLLRYEPETGELFWLPRPVEMFLPVNGRTALNCCNVWNAKYAGKRAGKSSRYIVIKLLGQAYLAHRIIWKIVTGEEPDEIDHMDRDKLNNRWSNLRNVNHSTNMMNVPLRPHSTSGEKHIHWFPRLGKWTVCMMVPGKLGSRQLAYCETVKEAREVRQRFYAEFGYNADMVAQ